MEYSEHEKQAGLIQMECMMMTSQVEGKIGEDMGQAARRIIAIFKYLRTIGLKRNPSPSVGFKGRIRMNKHQEGRFLFNRQKSTIVVNLVQRGMQLALESTCRICYLICGNQCKMKIWGSLFKIIKTFKMAAAQL